MEWLAGKPGPAGLAALTAAAVNIGLLLYSLSNQGLFEWRPDQSLQATPRAANIEDHGTHLVYVPDGVSSEGKRCLLFALSPSGDAHSMILKWHKAADRHGWYLAASKESVNGVPFNVVLPLIEAELRAVQQEYDVDPQKVIFTGLSGGGMSAHAFAKFYPDLVCGIIINTGMMEESFMTEDHPEGKLAVFLASPADFRFNEMKRDRSFPESHRWKTWRIEFSGGHRLAPDNQCEKAARWFEENFR